MSAIDTLSRLKFSGIQFPYQSIRTSGGLRDHIHEYPHVAGGSPEKLGRKLYTISVSTQFDARLRNPVYHRLYPNDLNVLLALFEDGTTAPLEVPGKGKFPAYCRNWTCTLDSRIRSGEAVELEFQEDQPSAFLALVEPPATVSAIPELLEDIETLSEKPTPSLLNQIRDAVNEILAIRDQGLMWRGVLVEKLEEVRSLFVEADATLEMLKNPINSELIEAFQRLWEAMTKLLDDASGNGAPLRVYTTPKQMTATEVSLAIWGDTQHVVDVLSLNSIDDPYLIRAGTQIRFFG